MVDFVYDNESNSAYWNDNDAFNSYMTKMLKDEVNGGLDVATESWFKHDTGGTLTAVENLEEWVRKNLDLSIAPNCKIVDAYGDDFSSIFVSIQGPEDEIEEIKHYNPSIWEFKFNPNYVEKIGNSSYEFVFGLEDYVAVNPENTEEELKESKIRKNKITETVSRVKSADELKELVSRFIAGQSSLGVKGNDSEERKQNRVKDLAELLIKEARWVGFPEEALKWLPYIIDDSCLLLGPISISELLNEVEKQLNFKKLGEGRILKPGKSWTTPDSLTCVLMILDTLKFVDNIYFRVSSDSEKYFDFIENEQDAINYIDKYGEITEVQIHKNRSVLYRIHIPTDDEVGEFPISIRSRSKKYDLDDFLSYSKDEFKRDLLDVAKDIKNVPAS